MPLKIVILEDNEERQAAMRACLAERFPQYETQLFADPAAMLEYLEAALPETMLISLAHDLELVQDQPEAGRDPGTGRQVAEYLAKKPPACPVVIHTSNSAAAASMEALLQDAGWKSYRVVPTGDLEWIRSAWFRMVRRAIVAAAMRRSPHGPDPETGGDASSLTASG